METVGLYAIGSATAAIAGSPASTLVFEWLANWYLVSQKAIEETCSRSNSS